MKAANCTLNEFDVKDDVQVRLPSDDVATFLLTTASFRQAT